MTVEDTVVSQIKALIAEAEHLVHGNAIGQVRSEGQRQECAGWLTSAVNAVQLVCIDPNSPYRKRAADIVQGGVHLMAPTQVGELRAILQRLLVDLEAGLLTAIADRARAEIFDDFLDHGEVYWKDGRKQEAGVIAAVVFEDSLRRACRKRRVPEKGEKLDQLISALAAVGALSDTKAKRARVAAHVRTKATHAQWDEFDLDDVKATIDFTREFVAKELDK